MGQQVWDRFGAGLARDGEHVYICGKRIRGADPKTFRILTADRMGEGADTPS